MPNKNSMELTELNLFLNSIIENIPDMIFLKEAHSLTFVKLNKAAEELLGIKVEDMLGKNDYDFFPKKQADFFTEKDRAVLRSKTVLDIPVEEITSASLGKIYLHTKKIPLLDEKNEPIYLLGISENITEKINYEARILELNKMLEKKVKQRTKQLSDRNKKLAKEISERKAIQKKLNHSLLELRLLYESQHIASEIAELDALLQCLIELICRLTGWPAGHAYVQSASDHELRPSGIWYVADENKTKLFKEMTEKPSVAPGVGLPGRIWKSGCPQRVQKVPAAMRSTLTICAAIGFPIVVSGQVVAVCEFFLDKQVEADFLALFQMVGAQVGYALEKRTVHENLEAAELKSRLLLQSSAEGIYGIDTEGIATFVNQAAEKMMGYAPDELLGKPIHQMLHHDFQGYPAYPLEASSVYAAYHNGESHRVADEVMWRKDGKSLPVEYVCSPVYKNSALVGAVVVFSDITERKKTEEKLKAYALNLKRSNQDLDDFAYTASHDLKSPLRAIQHLAQWISEDCSDKLDDQSKKNLAWLSQRAIRMSNFIDGLLQYSRAGRFDSDLCDVDTKKLLQEVVDTLDPNKQFTIRYADNLPCFKTAKNQLSQVFFNLINNSILHHHHKTGVIEVGVHNLGDFYEFFVADDGPGIEPEYFEKIFQIFQTLKTKDELESTGIGLCIAKKIVESRCGGKITVESEKGKGSIFRFTWPKSEEQ